MTSNFESNLLEWVQIRIYVSGCWITCLIACPSVKVFPVPNGPEINQDFKTFKISNLLSFFSSFKNYSVKNTLTSLY